MTKTISKAAQAREAKAQGRKTFKAVCKHHGETEHYSSDGMCVACTAVKKAKVVAKLQGDPAARAAHNASLRRHHATSTTARGTSREKGAAKDWRKATGGNMTGWYELDKEALRNLYRHRGEGFEIDHAIAKRSTDSEGVHVASGLHCYANAVETPKAVNKVKRCQFSPDTNRLQRPANRFTGGAFDPHPTAHEQALIDQAKALGTPVRVSLKALRDSLDAKAKEYERYTASVLVRILSEVAA